MKSYLKLKLSKKKLSKKGGCILLPLTNKKKIKYTPLEKILKVLMKTTNIKGKKQTPFSIPSFAERIRHVLSDIYKEKACIYPNSIHFNFFEDKSPFEFKIQLHKGKHPNQNIFKNEVDVDLNIIKNFILKECEKTFVFIPIDYNIFENSSKHISHFKMGHSLMFIINKETKKCFLFNIADTENITDIGQINNNSKQLKKFNHIREDKLRISLGDKFQNIQQKLLEILNSDITNESKKFYIQPVESLSCPNIQTIFEVKYENSDFLGSCQLWSLWIIILQSEYPDKEINRLIKNELLKISSDNFKSFEKFIEKFYFTLISYLDIYIDIINNDRGFKILIYQTYDGDKKINLGTFQIPHFEEWTPEMKEIYPDWNFGEKKTENKTETLFFPKDDKLIPISINNLEKNEEVEITDTILKKSKSIEVDDFNDYTPIIFYENYESYILPKIVNLMNQYNFFKKYIAYVHDNLNDIYKLELINIPKPNYKREIFLNVSANFSKLLKDKQKLENTLFNLTKKDFYKISYFLNTQFKDFYPALGFTNYEDALKFTQEKKIIIKPLTIQDIRKNQFNLSIDLTLNYKNHKLTPSYIEEKTKFNRENPYKDIEVSNFTDDEFRNYFYQEVENNIKQILIFLNVKKNNITLSNVLQKKIELIKSKFKSDILTNEIYLDRLMADICNTFSCLVESFDQQYYSTVF